MKKHDVMELYIEEIRFPNIGLAYVDGVEVEVKGGLPGQRLLVRLVKKGKINKAQIMRVLTPAPQEITSDCSVFGICGGCSFQNIPYEYELQLKTKMVKDILLDVEGIAKQTLNDINSFGSPTERYRNKMEYSFGDDGNINGELTLGMRKKGSYYEALDSSCCLLCHPDFGKISTATLEYFKNTNETFYHRKKETGTLRHLAIRHGANVGEIIVNLVTAGDKDYSNYAKMLLDISLENTIVGIINTTTNSVADAIIPDEVKVLHGRDYYHEHFTEHGMGMTYKVPLFGFFQTNYIMVEKLYAIIAEFCGDLNNKTVFDLYCGSGTIGLYLARYVARSSQNIKKIVGIEIVEEAIQSAKQNAALNGDNAEFIAGDVKKIVREITENPDIIILDPPREGIVPKAIPHILAFGAKKIVYISCKPTSLAANLPAFIEGGYTVAKIQCVDMFARTANIETIVLLEKS
ncbi:MAG: 23S rRNA (uracil(1939)-C(5))-methyltransferase RlmD [Defluviitaleaceae bacterium]|nr:23S rRNA (uracil(1939)-C(5))-methyltransferase RlmD [Defluviitaleaceae bacterium]